MIWQNLQQCDECWEEENPDREPFRMDDDHCRENTVCVTCNRMTISGIYVRKEVQ